MARLFSRVESKLLSVSGAMIDRNLACKGEHPLIVSNNCWGAEYYSNLNLPYPTPFIGLFILPQSYLKLVNNFDSIFRYDLKVEKGNEFPIGYLGDVKLNFLHYKSKEEAYEKFNRRLERFYESKNRSKILFKFCDVDGATKEQIASFHKYADIYGESISFCRERLCHSNSFKIYNRHIRNDKIPNGLHLYKLRYSYLNFSSFIKKLEN